MKFTQFLMVFAVNVLSIAIPNAIAVYFAVRLALRSKEK